MAGIKISALSTVSLAQLTDIFPVVQGGVTYQESLLQVASLFGFTSGILGSGYGGTGVSSPTAHSLPVAQGSSAFNFLSLTNGQLLIGSTGADPVPANLTAGAGISISNSAGSITISATGVEPTGWVHVTSTSQAMAVGNGYIADNSGLVTLTLPVTAAFGTALSVIGKGSGGWRIAQNSGQNIQIGSISSTVGTGGSVSSTNANDSLVLICTVANTTWSLEGGPQGNLTIV